MNLGGWLACTGWECLSEHWCNNKMGKPEFKLQSNKLTCKIVSFEPSAINKKKKRWLGNILIGWFAEKAE